MKRLIFLLTNLFASTAYLMASGYHATTYNALGGDVVNDDLSDALKLLKKPLAISKTGVYRAVVKSNAGSAVWIGNGKTKSYFVTVGHVVNSATNTFTTHNGTTISPVAGSVFHRRDGDFGLLEYNALLDPMLFGGRSMILMDHNLVNNYAGRQTTIVGYGNIKIGGRSLGRHRMLSYSTLTPRIRLDDYTTRSVTNADDPRPYAGVATQGDSGGGVFMQANGENVLIGTLSAAGSSALYYTNLYYHKSFINSVVPKGVFQWFSEYKNTFTPVAGKKYYIDNPKHKLRLGATGTSGSLYTTANDTTGENVEWEFIAQNDGTYHIQLAKRNSKCRLCSVNTNKPAMRVMNYSGLFTRYVMEKAPGDNNYHITLPNVNSSIARLQVHSNGTPKFQSDTFDGTWVAFQFKEVPDNIVSIQKRYSKQHALASKGNAGSGGNVYKQILMEILEITSSSGRRNGRIKTNTGVRCILLVVFIA